VSIFFVICQALVFETESPESWQYVFFSVLLLILFCGAAFLYVLVLAKTVRVKFLEKKEANALTYAVTLNKTSYMDKAGTEIGLHLTSNAIHIPAANHGSTEGETQTNPKSPVSQSIRNRLESVDSF
jgi:hypothetical protein